MNHPDPVCGKLLRPADAVASAPYEQTLFHFCSQECHGRFWANPGLYVRTEPVDVDHSRTSPSESRTTPLPWHRTE